MRVLADNKDFAAWLETLQSVDDRVYGALGSCVLLGGLIRIDTGIGSLRLQDATFDHELTHRNEMATTHFGNLFNLVGQARRVLDSFSERQRLCIQAVFAQLRLARFIVPLEGNATYHQRRFFPDVSEADWLSSLARLPIRAYHDGYICARSVMRHFPAGQWLAPHLADAILGLPFLVPWYDSFASIESAYSFVRSLATDSYPDSRMRQLVACIDRIASDEPGAIARFCMECAKEGETWLAEAQKRRYLDETPIAGGYVMQWTCSPTGMEMAAFVRTQINKHLAEPLKSLGFVYADRSTVPTINRIVAAWNREALPGKERIQEFSQMTTMDSQVGAILQVPIARKRCVFPLVEGDTEQLMEQLVKQSASAYCIGRLYQVWERTGWEVSKAIRVPYGGWYCVLGIRSKDISGPDKLHMRSPGLEGDFLFVQQYSYFGSASDLIRSMPLGLRRVLWVVPATHQFEYEGEEALKQDVLSVVEQLQKRLAPDSDVYSAITQNTIQHLIARLIESRPNACHYYESPHLPWRLWRTEGTRKEVFISARARDFSHGLKDWLTAAGIPCSPSRSEHDPYLLEWLGTGEGF